MPYNASKAEVVEKRLKRLSLPLLRLGPERTLYRIFEKHHEDPLGAGPSNSRFSDPRRGSISEAECYREIYLAGDLYTALKERIIRDRTDDQFTPMPISRSELESFDVAEIRLRETRVVVDLLHSTAWHRLGIRSDTIRAADHTEARYLALALHRHPVKTVGFGYPSRLTGKPNLMVFAHALDDFEVTARRALIDYDIAPYLARCGLVVV